ncbi:hypothetical protein F0562_034924 [Nyssa sinensis]|uniref:peroxidase n=1 Tax=Nyssa sinensis TaxID=561372 RepID=A0A5J5ADT0_9ASTE|nr:hypothetical protein F0562_034924 [Nyssa sinensis]
MVEGGGLSFDFYERSCPQVEDIVRAGLQSLSLTDPTSPAALLRLMFHDCQVQGCDASILVDPDNRTMSYEMTSTKNFGIRKRETISIIKSMVEAVCPQQVSCADILILAAREAIAMSGGPRIRVPLGRRDSSTPPNNKLADAFLPPADIGVDGMLRLFANKGMTIEESEDGEPEDQIMEPGFEIVLSLSCPFGSLTSNSSFVLNDPTTLMFDNQYYVNAMRGRGTLKIDAEMPSDPRTAQYVERFAVDQNDFFQAFSSAFLKLSSSGVLTDRQVIVRITFQILTVLVLLAKSLAENVPANFIFGDSLVDAGNNNYILSLSKANYIPNGVDLGKPTGRYTNGRTIIDIIGQELGFKDFTPPFLAPTTVGTVVLQGVNYASGGGGILNHTGKIFGGRINLDAQMDNFANTRQDIISSLGVPAAMNLWERALFSITIGSNDFINNYLTPVVSTVEQKLVPPEMFVGTMVSRFRIQLTRLYNMGARKVVVANVGPIGCIPCQRDLNPSAGDGCVAFPNELAQLFNIQLKSLVEELITNLKGSKFVYADVYHIVEDILQNYISYGFENVNSSCCYLAGRFGGLIPCGPPSKVCWDRSKYVFWDPYHPTDAANSIIAKRLVDGDSNDISPMNIRHLIES